MLREKSFAKKKYKLWLERKVLPIKNIGFAKKKNSKKKYKFCQELANKKYRFCQELEKFSQKNIGFAMKEKI